MTPEERFERIERTMDDSAKLAAKQHAEINAILQGMAARQQYHDEAFDRMDAGLRELREAGLQTERLVQTLSNILLLHEDRLDNHAARLKKLDKKDDDESLPENGGAN